MKKIGLKQASEEILEAKKCKKLVMKRLYVIIGFKIVLSDQETPDKISEHDIDADFHAKSEYRVHSGQFLTILDIIRDVCSEILRLICNNKSRSNSAWHPMRA